MLLSKVTSRFRTTRLQLLERDIAEHPERLRGMPDGLYLRLLAVTDGMDVGPDEPIEGPVAL